MILNPLLNDSTSTIIKITLKDEGVPSRSKYYLVVLDIEKNRISKENNNNKDFYNEELQD